MDAYEKRFASFTPKKSSKSRKQQAASGGWPHPPTFRATPARLAQAGFYFKPSMSKPDSVLCFLCGHALGNWEERDDPFNVHVEHSPKCAWAIARCSIEDDKRGNKFVFRSTARLPTSRALEKARADTFKGSWPHDNIKGHSANSKKMAKAGWVFTPEAQQDSDTATCYYCGKSLAGWEPEDNPTEEHRNRMPNCPFFTAKVTPEDDQEDGTILAHRASTSQASTSRSRSGRTHTHTASQSNRIAATISASEAEPGGDGEDDIDTPALSNKKLPSSASAKSVTATPVDPPRGVSRSAASKRLKTQDEDTEMAVDNADEPPQPIVSKSSSKTRKGKAKSPQTTAPSDLDEQEVVPISTRPPKTAKGRKRPMEEVQVIDLDDDEIVEVPPPKKSTAKSTKSSSKPRRGKTKAAIAVQEDEPEAGPGTPIGLVDIQMEAHKPEPLSIRAPLHPVARSPPPKPSQVVPVVVPKLALQPASRPSKEEDEDLKAAEEELENMAMELDPTGEVRSLLKSKTNSSSSRPASSRGDVKKPQKPSLSSGPQKYGEKSTLHVTSSAWLKPEPKSTSRAGSVRAMMAEDEVEEEEVARSLDEIEEEGEGEGDPDAITKLRPQGRNAERPPSTVPPLQTNRQSKTLVERPTSSSASAKGKGKAIDPLQSAVAPPVPRTPSPAAATNIFPPLREVDGLPALFPPDEAHVHRLTEEDKDMTVEAYIRLQIERRKAELRADGEQWIEDFLAYAEQARETIRAM